VFVLRFFEDQYILEVFGIWGCRFYARADDISRDILEASLDICVSF
jgi:hypothetical protein